MTPFPRILVATDFSDHSRHAFGFAAEFAARYGCTLDVVHILPTRHTLALHVQHEDSADAYLEEFLSALDREHVASASWKKSASEYEGILAEAEERKSDLIVVGTRGRSALVGMLLGSVATRVIQHARIPVLTVPEHVEAPLDLKRILCAVDFSAPSNEALKSALALATSDNSQLLLVHAVPLVYPPVYGLPGIGFTNYQSEIEKHAEDAMKKLRESLGEIAESSSVAVIVGRASEVICHVAEEERCDLIVMGSRNRSGLDHALVGSMAERVARASSTPILCIKATQSEA